MTKRPLSKIILLFLKGVPEVNESGLRQSPRFALRLYLYMDFFNSAVEVLQTLVIALGGGLCVWGGINLLEGYGNDNPGAKSQGVKQLVAGGGVALIGVTLIPLLSGLLG